MMTAKDFLALVEIERKTDAGMSLNKDEKALLALHGPFEPGPKCRSCMKPLGPRVDGEHHKVSY